MPILRLSVCLRRIIAACVAGVSLAAGLVGCASAPPDARGSDVRPLPDWLAQDGPAHGVWSTEDEAGRTHWRDWEARIRQLADVQVGSAPGVPVGDKPVRLHWRHYVHRQEQRGGVVISVGFTEGLTMYQEVIHDLVRNGYSVYIQDHRGQGFSTRLTEGTVGHVNDFDRLVDDLSAFVNSVSVQRGPGARPLFGLAHSMGGAVLAGVLERQGADSPLAAVALFTPMFEPAVAAPEANLMGRALQG